MSNNVTRRVMQLTQRNIELGMTLTEARQKAHNRAQFEKDIELYSTSHYPPIITTLGGK